MNFQDHSFDGEIKLNSNNNQQKEFPDLDTAQTFDFEDLQEIVNKLLKANEYTAEEIAIAEGYIAKEQPKDKSVNTDDDSLSDASDGGSSASAHYTPNGKSSAGSGGLPAKKSEKRKNKNNQGNLVLISMEAKTVITLREIDDLRAAIEEESKKFEKSIEDMKAKVEEADLEIEEVEKETDEFQNEIVTKAVNPRTGMIFAEKMLKYFEVKMKNKDGLVGKLKLKVEALKSQVKKLKKQLEQREELGEDLKKIDFHKLKIENDQMSIKIDELNGEVTKLKLTSGKTLQVLTALMDKLTKLTSRTQWLKKQISIRNKNIDELTLEIERVLKQKESEVRNNSKLAQRHELVKVPSILEYVKLKKELDELKLEVKNWERKCEIVAGNHKVLKQKAQKLFQTGNGSFGVTTQSLSNTL